MRRIERKRPDPAGKTLAFTGHRPNKYPCLGETASAGYRRIRARLELLTRQAIEEGFTHFVCGGALGVDTMAALLVLDLRRENPRLTLEIVVPCEEQPKLWPESNRKLYGQILASADVVTWISTEYTPFCMRERNCYMVDVSSRLIAVHDGSRGGTFMTLELALEKGMDIITLNPKALLLTEAGGMNERKNHH